MYLLAFYDLINTHFCSPYLYVLTHSASPYSRLSNIGHINGWEKGVARCPFDPEHSVTSLLTTDGSLYVGTPTDFSGEGRGGREGREGKGGMVKGRERKKNIDRLFFHSFFFTFFLFCLTLSHYPHLCYLFPSSLIPSLHS